MTHVEPTTGRGAVVDIEAFLGEWYDSKTNDIYVSFGKKDEELSVTLNARRHGMIARQFFLTIKRYGTKIGQFSCGSYNLDFKNSHTGRLRWVSTKNKRDSEEVSVWRRPGDVDGSLQYTAADHFDLADTNDLRTWDPCATVSQTQPSRDVGDANPALIKSMHERLAQLVNRSQAISDRFSEIACQGTLHVDSNATNGTPQTGEHNKLHLYIRDIVIGAQDDGSAWEGLGTQMQQELQALLSMDMDDASKHLLNMLGLEDPMAFSSTVLQELHGRIISLVSNQPRVGDVIVESAPRSKPHLFFKDVVRGDKAMCRKHWMQLSSKFREDIMSCISMDEGPQSETALLRIIEASSPSNSGNKLGWPSSEGAAQSGYGRGSRTVAQRDNMSAANSEGTSMGRLESISRKLSLVLRHDTTLAVHTDGFCKVDDVLALRRFREMAGTIEDIQQVVAGAHESGNSKQRFQLKEEMGQLWIRANQGYSRKDILAESAYRRLQLDDPDNPLPDPCVHGTYHRHWKSILEQGLLAGGLAGRQGRNEIHFACEEPGGSRRAISGMRYDCDLAIWLDLKTAITEGLPFYVSDNNVILSPGNENGCIPSSFFVKAMDLRCKPPQLIWPPEQTL